MVCIGVAVLGAGDISANVFVSSFLNYRIDNAPIISIVALWDPCLNSAHSFANEFSLPLSTCCSREDDALTHSDVVVAAICGVSPANQPALAAKAIQAGKHVILVPGYPLSINYEQNSHLEDALGAYPSLICALASGFHYLPAFNKLRSEVLSKLVNENESVRSISFSATTSPLSVFGRNEWQDEKASGGGVLSQIGAPMLDAALLLLLQVKERIKESVSAETSVIVQGRTAQLLDDSIDFSAHAKRLWPRTAEDACWVQVDLRKRVLGDSNNVTNEQSKKSSSQTVVCLEIVTSETVSEDEDPVLSVVILADGSIRFKTDGHSLWLWERTSQNSSYTVEQSKIEYSSLALQSVSYFAELVASEIVNAADSGTDFPSSGALFSSVMQKLLVSRRITDIGVALASQKLIDAARTSFLGTAIQLDSNSLRSNQFMWSQSL